VFNATVSKHAEKSVGLNNKKKALACQTQNVCASSPKALCSCFSGSGYYARKKALNTSKSEATYEDGLLRIRVPFKDPMEDAFRVPIQ